MESWEDEEALAEQLDQLQLQKAPVRKVKGRGALKYEANEPLGEEPERENPRRSEEGGTPTKNAANEEFEHVLELYGFDEECKTADLDELLKPFKQLGYRLKWVDDSHCLVIFRSAAFAKDALQRLRHPSIRLRPFSQASQSSRHAITSTRKMEWESPSNSNTQARPATSTVVANRMIGNILQIPQLQKQSPSPRQQKPKATDYWDS